VTVEDTAATPPTSPVIRLPLAKPVVVNILLGVIGVVFLAETVFGGSTSTSTLRTFGAQVNSLVAAGAYWRLLAAMFLHIGLMHVAFNGWALFSIGRDVEAFYGPARFTALFLITGLAGNVAYYLLGPDVLSAGASGAIFGLIGAEAAFFVRNRPLFGKFGRERLINLLVMIGINLVFGFTVQGVNNIAHLGGLLSGFLLSLALSPRYQFAWAHFAGQPEPVGMLIDVSPKQLRWIGIAAAIILLLAGTWLGARHWTASATLLREQAQSAMDANELSRAQALMQQAVESDRTDPANHYGLGIVLARRGELNAAAASLEVALQLAPEQVDTQYALGLVYAQADRTAEARAMLERFLAQESTGERAQYALQVLSQLPK
jgi:rhomboid protease GluP